MDVERSAGMSVITISREFGCGGDVIARQVAQALSCHFVDQKFVSTILGQYGYVEFDKEYANLPTFWERFDAQREKQRDVMMNMLNRVIRATAHHGNVIILGRSGFEILRDFAEVLHVRLQAPFSIRVKRIMEEQQISAEQAESTVKQNDKVRITFVEEFYRVPWNAIHAFDLVINTGKIAPATAVDWIVDTAKASMASLEEDKPTTASIDVDRILSEAISDELKCKQVHSLLSQPVHP
jgi:cytidylate kinase